jgi:hypothetical protein
MRPLTDRLRAKLFRPVFVAARRDRPGFTIQVAIALAMLLCPASSPAEQVAVRYAEGLTHGFLALRTLDGSLVANGDLVQTVRGFRVIKRMVFHFKDGSVYTETTIFSQRDRFRLLWYHVAQKGSRFPQPTEMTIDASNGQVIVRYTDDRGQPKAGAAHLDLPPDLANGLVLTLLKNIDPSAPPKTLTIVVAATPKPRIVTLELANAGRERFTTGVVAREATHFVLKPKVGGLAGIVAPFVGKAPPDAHVWILGGEAPAFIKSEQPLYAGGPLWRIEAVSPTWPRLTARK